MLNQLLLIITPYLLLFTGLKIDKPSPGLHEYYPIKDNLVWKYTVKENDDSFTQTIKMQSEICENGQLKIVLDTKSIRQTKYEMELRNDTLYLNNVFVNFSLLPFEMSFSCDPPMQVFFFNKNPGFSWEWQGVFSNFFYSKKVRICNKILDSSETIKINNNVYTCLVIESVVQSENEREYMRSYYSKNIGLICVKSDKHTKSLVFFNGN